MTNLTDRTRLLPSWQKKPSALLTPLQISFLFSLCCAYCLLMHRCVLFFPFQVFKSDSHWSSESAWWINIWFADIPWQHYKHCESHRRPINLEFELKNEKQAFKHAPQSWKCPHNNELFLKPWISIHLWFFKKGKKVLVEFSDAVNSLYAE